MLNPIKRIVQFNSDAGLLGKGYDDFLESSFQIEEALEGLHPEFIIKSMHNAVQEGFKGMATSPKDVARHLVSTAITSDLNYVFYKASSPLPETPDWSGTDWDKDLLKAIKEEYVYIEDSDGLMFKILSRDSVKGVAKGITDVDRLDKACDSVVYAIGSMAKLGLSAQEITQALNIVMDKNLEKLKNKQYDAEGKLLKDFSFVGPEAQLQALLDKRK